MECSRCINGMTDEADELFVRWRATHMLNITWIYFISIRDFAAILAKRTPCLLSRRRQVFAGRAARDPWSYGVICESKWHARRPRARREGTAIPPANTFSIRLNLAALVDGNRRITSCGACDACGPKRLRLSERRAISDTSSSTLAAFNPIRGPSRHPTSRTSLAAGSERTCRLSF